MAQLVKVSLEKSNESTLEINIQNSHPDAFDLSKVVSENGSVRNFAAYALGLMLVPALQDNSKTGFIQAVKKYKEEEGFDSETISVGTLDTDFFLQEASVKATGNLDYKQKLKELEEVEGEESDDEYELRMNKIDALAMPFIQLTLVFKPEHHSFLTEFDKVSFGSAYDYYSM